MWASSLTVRILKLQNPFELTIISNYPQTSTNKAKTDPTPSPLPPILRALSHLATFTASGLESY